MMDLRREPDGPNGEPRWLMCQLWPQGDGVEPLVFACPVQGPSDIDEFLREQMRLAVEDEIWQYMGIRCMLCLNAPALMCIRQGHVRAPACGLCIPRLLSDPRRGFSLPVTA